MHLPEPIYRAVPYTYVTSGALVGMVFKQPAGIVSAMLLVMAGLYIFNARITKRIRRHELGVYRRCEMAHTCDNRIH